MQQPLEPLYRSLCTGASTPERLLQEPLYRSLFLARMRSGGRRTCFGGCTLHSKPQASQLYEEPTWEVLGGPREVLGGPREVLGGP